MLRLDKAPDMNTGSLPATWAFHGLHRQRLLGAIVGCLLSECLCRSCRYDDHASLDSAQIDHFCAHSTGKTQEKEAEDASTGCRAEVSISLRACVPTVSVAAAAVAIRMAERWQRYEQYSPFWQVRPRVSAGCFPLPVLQTLTIKCSFQL